MSNDAKFFFAMVWIYSLFGTALFFHDFGTLEGERMERERSKEKLSNCLAVIRGGE